MAKFNFGALDQPIDASFGLIYRLNGLWSEADIAAKAGRFLDWDAILDRIFCNLLFEKMIISEFDDDGNLIKSKLAKEDKDVYKYLNNHVKKARAKLKKAKSRKEYTEANERLYQALMIKDVGLRKFQHKLKIYFRKQDSNPAKAMWGG